MNSVEAISPDEPCYGLTEANKLIDGPDGSREWHRVQTVYVARNGALCAFVKDFGSAFLWEAIPIQAIYASGDETVGQCLEEAEKGRHDDFGAKLKAEIAESSTLIKDFLQEKEENWERIRNRSVFGPARTKQRNGFPAALRRR